MAKKVFTPEQILAKLRQISGNGHFGSIAGVDCRLPE